MPSLTVVGVKLTVLIGLSGASSVSQGALGELAGSYYRSSFQGEAFAGQQAVRRLVTRSDPPGRGAIPRPPRTGAALR